jgi:putative addiction module killer protein
MPPSPQTIIVYRTAAGQEPFTLWLHTLRDPSTRRRILQRLFRLENGNFGDCHPVGGGVSELRFFFGSGYRVYYGEEGDTLVVLLCGGDKSSQSGDIRQAQAFWKEYLRHDR